MTPDELQKIVAYIASMNEALIHAALAASGVRLYDGKTGLLIKHPRSLGCNSVDEAIILKIISERFNKWMIVPYKDGTLLYLSFSQKGDDQPSEGQGSETSDDPPE